MKKTIKTDELKILQALFKKKEPLDPELEAAIEEGGPFGKMIRHPLVFEMIVNPEWNAMLNARLKMKKEQVEVALKAKSWVSYIFLHERPYRLEAAYKQMAEMSPREWWEILGEIWTDSENIWQYQSEWDELLESEVPETRFFMSAEEREVFDGLPEEITIHRGYKAKHGPYGFSYTLDKEKALWFAKRYATRGDGAVMTRTVRKEDCFAYKGERNEKEIIIRPRIRISGGK